MKAFLDNVFRFFEGSNLFAFICLMLGLMFGFFGYLAPKTDAGLQTTYYAFAAVLSVLGVSMYFNNFFGGNMGGRRFAR